LVDLGSVNGSYIDFNKVIPYECTKLEDGMEFWFGYSSEKWTLRRHDGIKVRKDNRLLILFNFVIQRCTQ